jgi:hypothetical protein
LASLVAALLVWGGLSVPIQGAAAHQVSVLEPTHAAAFEQSADAPCERQWTVAFSLADSPDSADAYDDEDGLRSKHALSLGSADRCLTGPSSVLETHRSLSLASDIHSLRAPPL